MAEFYKSGKNAVVGNEEEFQEEDVWGVMKGRGKLGKDQQQQRSSSQSASAAAYHRIIPNTPRVIPRVQSESFESHHGGGHLHRRSSAPVNIPDWSKIRRKQNDDLGHDGFLGNNANASAGDEDLEEEEDIEEMLPPHEFIARRLARTPIASFSMCEGIGRTLKGRDISRLRNAILTKTGFLE